MAFTPEQEAGLLSVLSAFQNAKRLKDLPTATGKVSDMQMIVQDETGETRKMPVYDVVANANNPMAGRYWDETNATPKAAGYYGSLEALKALPSTLGLGRYLVTDDRVRRKLDPIDSTKFDDGTPAALDGSMGQCMWCWNAHYYTTWKEGNYCIEVITFSPIPGKKSIYVPAGGISWLGVGVVDRANLMLASVISEDENYRGGNNAPLNRETYPNIPENSPQHTMLGMPTTHVSTHNSGIYARKRGEGWESNWVVARAVIEYTERIIFGTRNIQAAFNSEKDTNGLYQGGLGAGVTNMPSWGDWNGNHPIIPTGVGLEMGDGVGVVNYELLNADGSVKYTAPVPVFFGLVGAGYGHLWSGVRGLVIDAGEEKTLAYVAPSMYDPFDDTTVADKLRVAELPRTGGYIKRLSMKGLCALPTEVGGSASTYFPDYFYTNVETSKGLRVRLAGGHANDGTNAGAAYSDAHHAASYATASISAPLCYFEEDPVIGA